MKISSSAKITVPDGVLVQELQGESVLLNVNTENYYGLDEVGTRMWVVLSEASSISQAIDILLLEYDVDRERLVKDVCEFVSRLLRKELIELS